MGELPYRYDVQADYDRYEYQTTEGQRKCWDGEPDLGKEGWEEWAEWERFDYTEERYWRKLLTGEALAVAQRAKADRERTTAVLKAERKVIKAAKKTLRLWDKFPLTVSAKSVTYLAFVDAMEATRALIATESEE